MTFELERLAVHTGYKFYHNEYDLHSNHILQLLTDLYFELDIFRELWNDRTSTEIFLQDILRNLASIRDAAEGSQTAHNPQMSQAKGKGKQKAAGTLQPGNIDDIGMGRVGEVASSSREGLPASRAHLQIQRRVSPTPLRLDLHRGSRRDRCKPLTIKLPPTKRSESVSSDGEGSNPNSIVPPAATSSALPAEATSSRTQSSKRSYQLQPKSAVKAEEAEVQYAEASISSRQSGNWRHQSFHREYTTRGPITANTARHESSPKHSPILPSCCPPLTRRPGAPHSRSERTTQKKGPGNPSQELEKEGAIIPGGGESKVVSRSGQKRRLPSTNTGLGMRRVPRSASMTTASHNNLSTGKGKRGREEDAEEAKGEVSQSRKRTRRN